MSKYFTPTKLTISEVISFVGAVAIGNNLSSSKVISGLNTIDEATNDQITFLYSGNYGNQFKYIKQLETSNNYACLIDDKSIASQFENHNFLLVDSAHLALAKLLTLMYKHSLPVHSYVSENAFIADTATIGKNCTIEHGCFIGDRVVIGNDVYIGPNSIINHQSQIGDGCIIHGLNSIKYTTMGNQCIVHEGAKIGQDGFGFVVHKSGNIKVPQIGGVVIESEVEIGANSCIDRGSLKDTIIKQGTKIDNLVQIAHNNEIGSNCFLAAQAGIAGSNKIGDRVAIGGQAGIAPHLEIESMVQIAPQSGIFRNVPSGSNLIGTPAKPFYNFWKIEAIVNKLIKKNKS